MKILWTAIGVAVAILLAASVYTVGENQVALRFQFGRMVGPDAGPGLHFRVPLVQTVQLLDRRTILSAQPKCYLPQEKDVSVDCVVAWRIADPHRFFAATQGTQAGAEQQLAPVVVEALRHAIGEGGLPQVVALDRSHLGDSTLRQVNEQAGRTLGIEVVDIRIRRIDLPDGSGALASVYDRMRAERSREAAQLRAEGQEEVAKIQADADRQRLVIAAEADRDVQRLQGEGDAQATAIAAQVYGQDPEFYAFYRSLQSYRTMFGGRDVLVLDPDSDLLRYFASPGRAAPPSK